MKYNFKLNQIQSIAPNLWMVNGELIFSAKGLFDLFPQFLRRANTRMTILRLSDGNLILHSPIRIEQELKKQIDALGTVKFIIGPNAMHNSFILQASKLYPDAQVQVAPKTKKRCPELAIFPELNNATPIADDELPQQLMIGHTLQETLFYHPATKTLLVTDFACNTGPEVYLGEKLYMSFFKAYGQFALPSYHRPAIKDKQQFQKSMERVLSWDFDRVIMCHGKILENGGKEAFKKIWQWAMTSNPV